MVSRAVQCMLERATQMQGVSVTGLRAEQEQRGQKGSLPHLNTHKQAQHSALTAAWMGHINTQPCTDSPAPSDPTARWAPHSALLLPPPPAQRPMLPSPYPLLLLLLLLLLHWTAAPAPALCSPWAPACRR